MSEIDYNSRGGSSTRISNTIIFQSDPDVQEVWDVARTIKCEWVDNYVKTVAFDPFSVGMLDAQEVVFEGDQSIECWMDLLQGRWPDVKDMDSIVRIGETLSLLVYARDNAGMYDVSIKDCFAYGGPDYDSYDTPSIQLTDEQGCVLKDKLISQFYSTRQEDSEGEVIVTYAFIQAFKFPDVMDVYMSCNVDICKGECDNKCQATTAPTITTTTEGPIRRGSTLFGEAITTLAPTTVPTCFPGSTDPSCARPTIPDIPTDKCTIDSTDPACQINFPEQNRPSTFVCGFGSTDPRCQTPTEPTTPEKKTDFGIPARPTVPSFQCTPESNDPRCPPPTPAPPRCYPGSTDPRCPKPTTTTPSPPRCYQGSTDPRCPKPTTTPAPRCYEGSTDPRCPKPTTTPAPRCYEGSTDPRCPKPTTPRPPRCYQGSTDPRCPKPTTTTRSPPRCYKGSNDPRCPKPTTTPKPICYPGSPDPRCPSYKPEPRPTPRPKPTTTDTPRRGSILFPATITTTRPTTTTTRRPRPRPTPTPPRPALKPRPTPTRKPNRGKQLDAAPQPKPEPTGKEWEGESRYHAFHSYHFQRGDGRRGRTFGARLSRSAEDVVDEEGTTLSRLPRSARWVLMRRTPLEEETLYQQQSQPLQHQQVQEEALYQHQSQPLQYQQVQEEALYQQHQSQSSPQQQRVNKRPVRLSRSVSVAAMHSEGPSDRRQPVPFHAQPTAAAQTSTSVVLFPDAMETVCFPMAVFAAGMLSLLFLLLLSSTAALVLYIRKRDPYEDDKAWNTR
ncbi:hypothetical protein Pmani_021218 [Petrolisthes manimaculis]|uniref:ZP domain-containing protein n=1 Tax=Petrolisthes manimaculis TaxID=1843537 RepID=A0AAE1PE89_9EUCA|nr:hypothetical protein Pmani_021218 [Petrolisthes manimaculis]